VGVLFVLWGLLTATIGVSTLALAVAALALMTPAPAGSGGQLAAGLMATMFLSLALIAILWGAAHVTVGLPLRRHRPRSRLLALSLASMDLVLLPYGTALGCYTLWTLLSEDARRLFLVGDEV
jgi:hypothetical protein